MKLRNSNWVNRGAISLENLEKLLQYAWILNDVPDAIVNSFDREIESEADENFLFTQIKKHLAQCPTMDSSFIEGIPKSSGTVPKQQTQHSSDREVSRLCATTGRDNSAVGPRSQGRCYNCNRRGHTKKFCNVKYCSACKSAYHGWRYCPLLKQMEIRNNPLSPGLSGRITPRGGNLPGIARRGQNFWGKGTLNGKK